MLDLTSYSDTILIVDDNAANRHLLKAILAKQNYKTAECENGQECIDYCKNNQKPMLVLLDVMMPVVDGIQACREIRKTYSKVELPIIMVTTRDSGENIADGFSAGACDYVTKPIDKNILLSRIENQIRTVEFQQSLFEANRFTERALRIQGAMGDALPEGILIHDSDGRIIYRNRRIKEMTNQQNIQTLPAFFKSAYQGVFEKVYMERYCNIAPNSELIIDEEISSFSDNNHIFMHVVSKIIEIPSENALRIWVFRDASKERLLERRINQQVKMETVGLFAVGVSHNFNNLLASISGAAQIIKRSINKPERLDRLVAIINQAVEAGMALTKRMAMSGHKDSHQNEQSNFGKVLKEVWQKASKQDKNIILDFQPELDDLKVSMAEEDLAIILENLIENANEAMEAGGEVICRMVEISPEKGRVSIALSDTGHGMDEESLNRAFEPFYSTRTLDHINQVSCSGRGLGMWNVYNILKMAQGDIRLESAPGSGATATISLPLVSVSEKKE